MAIADPKDYAEDKTAKKTATAPALSLEDLIAALKASSGNDDASMRKRAQFEAEARELLEEKENIHHPGISAYSYPEGDKARPKPVLVCETFWVGYPEMEENLTPQEIELLNEIQPGEYLFTRADGSRSTMSVEGKRDKGGHLAQKMITFACTGDDGKNLPTKIAQLQSAMGKRTREQELEAELLALKSTLAMSAA